MNRINKSQFVEELAAKTSKTVNETEKTVDTLINLIYSYVKQGTVVNFTGFGKFRLHERKARQGRNPRTGETITIPAGKTPRFTSGEKFNQVVNE